MAEIAVADDFTVETTGQAPIASQEAVVAAPVEEPTLESEAPEDEETPAAAPAPEPEPEKPVRQKETYGSKIGRLKAEKEAAELRAVELESQLAARTVAPAPTVPHVDPSDPEPVLDQFLGEADPYLAFTKASGRWAARQEQKAFAQQLAVQQRQQVWQSRTVEARKKFADFDTVMARGRSLATTPDVEQALLDSEMGPQLCYHLIQHPEEYRSLVALRGTALAKQIGKLEARLETVPGQVQATPVVPKPAPISPVQSSSVQATESSPEDLDFGPEYVRAMNRKDLKERGRLR